VKKRGGEAVQNFRGHNLDGEKFANQIENARKQPIIWMKNMSRER
jgi:hypothetical protein